MRSKFTYDTFQKAIYKGAGQTMQMHRLVSVCVVREHMKTGFQRRGPYQEECKVR